MCETNATELRQHLASYLARVREGEEVKILLHGKVIARLVPEIDERARAKAELEELRKTAWVGDIESPLDVEWDAEHGRL